MGIGNEERNTGPKRGGSFKVIFSNPGDTVWLVGKDQPVENDGENKKTARPRLLLLALLSFHAVAKQPSMFFRHIDIKDGLSSNYTSDLLQDRMGYLWIGTYDGLNRYDGYHFTVFRADPNDPFSISNNEINCLYEARNGDIWVGTAQAGLNRFDPSTGGFFHFRHNPKKPRGLGNNTVYAVTEDRNGHLWIGLENGLDCYDPKTDIFGHYRHDGKNPLSLGEGRVNALLEDRDGTIWAGTESGGLNRYEAKGDNFFHYRHDPNDHWSLGHNKVATIFEDRTGLWLGTGGAGLEHFESSTGGFTRFIRESRKVEGEAPYNIVDIQGDKQGAIWLGVFGAGLGRYAPATGKFRQYRHMPERRGSLSHDRVTTLLEDRSGGIWVGTWGGGINRYDPSSKSFIRYTREPGNSASLNNKNVWAIWGDDAGVLWIGTDKGLTRMDQKTDSFRFFSHDSSNPASLAHDRVYSIFEDRGGTLWIGMQEGGLDQFDRATERFTHYRNDPGDPRSLSNNTITSFYETEDDHLWLGTWEGLNRREQDGSFSRFNHDPEDPGSLSHKRVGSLCGDSGGRFWAGTWGGGLNRFDPATQSFSHFRHDPENPRSLNHDTIFAVHQDVRETRFLWLATGFGLNRFEKETGTFQTYTTQDGLSNNLVYGILQDGGGRLWLSTARGISAFDLEKEKFRNFELRDGLASNEFNEKATFKSPTGRLFFGGNTGMTALDPCSLGNDPEPMPVVITRVLVANKPVRSRDLDPTSPLWGSVLEPSLLVLDYQNKMIAFEFTNMDFSAPWKTKYAYKMSGFDRDWIETDASNRRATNTNLAPGAYSFLVKGTNRNGIWNEKAVSIQVKVTASPWLTWWAKTLYGLLLAAVFVWYLLMQRQKLAHLHKINEQQKQLAGQVLLVARKTESLREKDRLLMHEKMASMAMLTKGVAHEIKNPLNFIHNFTILSRDLAAELRGVLGSYGNNIDLPTWTAVEDILANLCENASAIHQHSLRANRIVAKMMATAFKESGEPELTDLNALLERVSKAKFPDLMPTVDAFKVTVEKDFDPHAGQLNMVPGEMSRVFNNVFTNAFEALRLRSLARPGFKPRLRLWTRCCQAEVTIGIRDNGMGIDQADLKNVFNPFFTTSAAGENIGLGLTICWEIVHGQGGRIEIQTEKTVFTEVMIHLPR